MRLLTCFLFGLLWLSPGPARGASLIEGVVLNAQNNQAVSGVTIRLHFSGRDAELSQKTDTSGRFSIDPATIFSAGELDTVVLAMTFSAQDYEERTQVKYVPVRGQFNMAGLEIRLDPLSGVWKLPDGLAQQLKSLKSTDGKALFVVPYSITDAAKKRLPANFMQILNFNIRRGISTHLQSLELDDIPEDISIQGLPMTLENSNIEKLRVIGAALNALALVGGVGGVGLDDGTGPVTELSSDYIIIPKLDGFNPGSLYIDDRLLGSPLNVTALYKGMDDLWGRNTVLAISALEARLGIAQKDTGKLERARRYLVAERAGIGADNRLRLRKINTLIAFIDRNIDLLSGEESQ